MGVLNIWTEGSHVFKTAWQGGQGRVETHSYVADLINPNVVNELERAERIRPPLNNLSTLEQKNRKAYHSYWDVPRLPTTVEDPVEYVIPWYNQPDSARGLFYVVVFMFFIAASLASTDPHLYNKVAYHTKNLARITNLGKDEPLAVDLDNKAFSFLRKDTYKPPEYSAPETDERSISALQEIVIYPEPGSKAYQAAAKKLQVELRNRSAEVDYLLVGDRFEVWRSTQGGEVCSEESECYSIAEMVREEEAQDPMLAAHGVSTNRKMVYGIKDDSVETLLWRILQTEAIPNLHPKICVVHVGTHDLSEMKPSKIAAGIRSVVRELQKLMPETHFVIAGLLPRADDVMKRMIKENTPMIGKAIDPFKDMSALSWTDSRFNRRVRETNAWLARIAAVPPAPDLKRPPMSYMDCTHDFLLPGEAGADPSDIPFKLMPDMLNLSLEGHRRWRACMRDGLQYLEETWYKKQQKEEPLHHKKHHHGKK